MALISAVKSKLCISLLSFNDIYPNQPDPHGQQTNRRMRTHPVGTMYPRVRDLGADFGRNPIELHLPICEPLRVVHLAQKVLVQHRFGHFLRAPAPASSGSAPVRTPALPRGSPWPPHRAFGAGAPARTYPSPQARLCEIAVYVEFLLYTHVLEY